MGEEHKEFSPSQSPPSPTPQEARSPDAVISCRKELVDKAGYFLSASNDRRRKQYDREAHAHAYAGVVNAIHIFDAHLGGSAEGVAARQLRGEPKAPSQPTAKRGE